MAKKTPVAAKKAPAPRTPLKDAPKPGVDPRDPSHVEDEEEEAADESLASKAASDLASPPSPTQEQLHTANDAPGAGGLEAGAAVVQPRKRTKLKSEVLYKVSVPKAFNLQLDDGSMVRYEAGTETMLDEHAEHWYAKANGVEIVD